MPSYHPQRIEPKWQQRWEADRLYEAEVDPSREKYYALVMFPYTSGDVHIGHWFNFAVADAHAAGSSAGSSTSRMPRPPPPPAALRSTG